MNINRFRPNVDGRLSRLGYFAYVGLAFTASTSAPAKARKDKPVKNEGAVTIAEDEASLICHDTQGRYYCSNRGPTRECVVVCGFSPDCSEELCLEVRDNSSCDEEYEGENLRRCLSFMLEDCRWGCFFRDNPPPEFTLEEEQEVRKHNRRRKRRKGKQSKNRRVVTQWA